MSFLRGNFEIFGQIFPERVEKISFSVNSPRDPKFSTYHQIHFHSLNMTFEISAKVTTSRSDISVTVNVAEMIISINIAL